MRGMFRPMLCGALFFAQTASLLADTPGEIQSLLDKGDAAAAYALADALAVERAGSPDFDFWYGLAALEAGHPDRAIFAFERVLLARPGHHRARLELGRAYFRQGDLAAARTSFQQVLSAEPPENVQRRVRDFIAAINRAERATGIRTSGHVALRIGTDSNINSATTDPRLDIPALGQLLLDNASLMTRDEFVEMTIGGGLLYPLTKFTGMFLDASLRERNNLSSSIYDLGVASLQGGILVRRGQERVRLSMSFQKLLLDDQDYRNMTSVNAEWTHQRDSNDQWSLFAQVGAFRYAEQTSLDTNLKLIGAAWNRRWTDHGLLGAASVYIGDERAAEDLHSYNGKSYHGLRLGLEWQRWARHQPFASLTLQQSTYDSRHPVFGGVRKDDFAELRLGWLWHFHNSWSARAEYSHVENHSNLSLYDYDRDQFMVGVRYGF